MAARIRVSQGLWLLKFRKKIFLAFRIFEKEYSRIFEYILLKQHQTDDLRNGKRNKKYIIYLCIFLIETILKYIITIT